MNPAWLAAGVHKDAATGTTRAAAVIRAGEMRHGWVLAVGGAQGLPGTAGVAVEQAALVAALEITRDLAVLAVEQQFASNALHDLVTGTAADMDQALQRAVRFGWDLQRPPAVLVARDCGDDAARPPESRPPEGHPRDQAGAHARRVRRRRRRHPADRHRPGDPPHVRDLRRQRRHLVSQDRAAGMLAENRAQTTLPAWPGGVQPQVSASALMT